MNTRRAFLFCLLTLLPALDATAAATFTEGQDYYAITPAQRTSAAPGKIEVLEVFSYGCPACNAFQPSLQLLKKSLPNEAQLDYLPAAFNAAEDWPTFQRAFFAAQALGIAERTHQQMYDAVWKNGELATIDPASHRLRSPQPTIEDMARAYARWTGVKPQDFVAMANSFAVDSKMRAADAQITAMQVPSTPCIVVNGHYRIAEGVRNPEQLIELVRFLVAKEAGH